MTAIVLAVMLAGGPVSQVWYENYEQAVRLIQDGRAAEALPLLERAVAARSSEAATLER